MTETCKSCGTIFDLDESILSNKVNWLKCGVCEEKWSVSLRKNDISNIDQKVNTFSSDNLEKFSSKDDPIEEINKVKNELASIKLVVENKSKQMSESQNQILELKNKSVAEIAAELSASKLTADKMSERKILDKQNKLQEYKNAQIKNVKIIPLILIFLILLIGTSIFLRSPILGYCYLLSPSYTEKYEKKINYFFNFIKLPIFVELKNIKIIDFGATFEKNNVNFFGTLQNNTNRPIISPKIKVLAVTEDGKIVIEKIIPMSEKIIMPSSKIMFSKTMNVKFKKENITVRASILKEIY